MSKTNIIIADDMRFESIADFKWSLENGGEIVFEWNGNSFGAFKYMKKNTRFSGTVLYRTV